MNSQFFFGFFKQNKKTQITILQKYHALMHYYTVTQLPAEMQLNQHQFHLHRYKVFFKKSFIFIIILSYLYSKTTTGDSGNNIDKYIWVHA